MEGGVKPSERLLRELEEIGLGAKSSKDADYHELEMAYPFANALEMIRRHSCQQVGWPDLNIPRRAMRRHGMTWDVSPPRRADHSAVGVRED
jgi:hypothetical protein